MKSDKILIDNQGSGFAAAVEETRKVAMFRGIDHKNTLQLQLMTEEMLSLIRSVTGEVQATFWLETEDMNFDLCLTTKTVMDSEKRYMLLESASSRKNEAAGSFLGKLRDAFQEAMAAEVSEAEYQYKGDSNEAFNDVYDCRVDDPEWDRYEQSILLRLADDVRISIKGKLVKMTVSKKFG